MAIWFIITGGMGFDILQKWNKHAFTLVNHEYKSFGSEDLHIVYFIELYRFWDENICIFLSIE